MGRYKLSFLTPLSNMINKKLVLEKKYSQHLTLQDGSTLSYASDSGHREIQQDSIAISQKEEFILLLVADGMGGLEHGENASYNTARIIKEWFEILSLRTLRLLSELTLKEEILKLICSIIIYIHPKSGTTLNMSIITPEKTLISNIGDSRTYTIKDGKLTLITKDDSQAFEIFNPKTREERDKLRFYIKNNVLNNAITKRRFPKVTITSIKNEEYDSICHLTDGVSDILSESEIEEFCQSPNPALTLVGSSIYHPIIHGKYHQTDNMFQEFIHPGKDNSTAIVYTKKRPKNN